MFGVAMKRNDNGVRRAHRIGERQVEWGAEPPFGVNALRPSLITSISNRRLWILPPPRVGALDDAVASHRKSKHVAQLGAKRPPPRLEFLSCFTRARGQTVSRLEDVVELVVVVGVSHPVSFRQTQWVHKCVSTSRIGGLFLADKQA